MHELSLIASIVDIAAEEVGKAGALQVDLIVLEVGELAGIEWEALDFAWHAGKEGTILANAECEVRRIPGQARCNNCGASFRMRALHEPCPHCGGFDNFVLAGRELVVKSLVVS